MTTRPSVVPMNNQLTNLLRRTDGWPQEAQSELAEIIREIEAELSGSPYVATPAELAGIDRGLRDAAQGKMVSDEDVKKTRT